MNDPDSGFVYMQARYYDSNSARFVSADSVNAEAGNLFNFNRYAYVNNSPVGNANPTGKQCAQYLYYPQAGIERQAAINQGASQLALRPSLSVIPYVGDAHLGSI